MQSVDEVFSAQIEVKKSKFIAFLCPFKDFENLLSSLKKEHLKAVHFVWSFRHLNEFHQIIEDKSDDFEPKNTAGLPILNVLRGAKLVNVALIVVRYFGGIKLGTGGLVKAYSNAANAVLHNAHFSELKQSVKLSVNLSTYSKYKHFFKKQNFDFKSEFKDKDVFITLFLNDTQKENLEIFLKQI